MFTKTKKIFIAVIAVMFAAIAAVLCVNLTHKSAQTADAAETAQTYYWTYAAFDSIFIDVNESITTESDVLEYGSFKSNDVYDEANPAPWYDQAAYISSVYVRNSVAPVSTAYWFYGFTQLTSANLKGLNTADLTDTNNMFGGCNNLNTITMPETVKDTVSIALPEAECCWAAEALGGSTTATKLPTANTITSSEANSKIVKQSHNVDATTNVCSFCNATVYYWYIFEDCLTISVYEDTNSFLLTDKFDDTNLPPWYGSRDQFTSVDIEESVAPTSTAYWFYGLDKVKEIRLLNLVTSNITDMSSMFSGCSALTLVMFDTTTTVGAGQSIDMNNTFNGCSQLTSFNFSNFNVKPTDLSGIFNGCSALESLEFGNNFDTSAVTDTSSMFNGCSAFTTLDLSAFNAGNVTKADAMFQGCDLLNVITTPSAVGETALPLPCKFWNGTKDIEEITSADVSTATVKKTIKRHASHDIPQSSYVAAVEATCARKGNKAYYTCKICGKHYDDVNGTNEITDVVIGVKPHTPSTSWSLDEANNQHYKVCTVCDEELDRSAHTYDADTRLCVCGAAQSYYWWKDGDTLYISSTDGHGSNYTRGSFLSTDKFDSTSPWYGEFQESDINFVKVEGDVAPNSTAHWFDGFVNVENIDLTGLDTSHVTDMSYMFNGCGALGGDGTDKSFGKGANASIKINDKFVTSNVTSMSDMFSGCKTLTSVDMGNCATAQVINMESMFIDCSNLTSVDLSNNEISQAVTEDRSMCLMFSGCSSLTELNLKNFNTANVTNMAYMFRNCSSLVTIDLSSFNTEQVTDIGNMFYGCSALTALDLSGFNTANATQVRFMFQGCTALNEIVTPKAVGATALPLPCKYWTGTKDIEEIASADASTETEKKTVKRHASHNIPENSYTAAVEANCTDAGNKEYYTCTICGKHYDDVNGTNEITDVVIPAKGHNFLEYDWVSDGASGHSHTCMNSGCTATETAEHTPAEDDNDCTTAVTCTVCEYVTKAAEASHVYGEYESDGASGHSHTCTNSGCTQKETAEHNLAEDDGDCTTAVICTVCGYVSKAAEASHAYGEYESDGASGHTHTCTNEGCTATETAEHTPAEDDGDCTTAVTCTVCGYVSKAAEANHVYGEYESDGASGHSHTCTNSGCTQKETAEHTPAEDDGDCTTAVTCQNCDYVFTAGEASHAYGEYTSDGASGHSHTCTNSGCTQKETVAHTPAADDNDCTTAVTCTVCGYVTKAAEANHAYGEYTSDENGHSHTCTNTGCTQNEAAEHTPAADDGDCTTAVTCTVCGYVTKAAEANHAYGEYTSDENGHTHTCTNTGCTQKETAEHTSADDGDCTTALTCTVCGYVIKAAEANHVYGNYTSDASGHYRACTHCGKKLDYAAHDFYVSSHKCKVCGAKQSYFWWVDGSGNLTVSATDESGAIEDARKGNFEFDANKGAPWSSFVNDITTVKIQGNISPTYMSNWFKDMTKLSYADLSGLKYTSSMMFLFGGCTALKGKVGADGDAVKLGNSIQLNGYINLAMMFRGCSGLTEIDLSSLTLGTNGLKCNSAMQMFLGCKALTSVNFGDVFKDNTCPAGTVPTFSGMFQNCTSLKTIDLSNFDFAHTKSTSTMFSGCTVLESVDFGNNFSSGNLTDTSHMFYQCKALTSPGLSKLDTSKVTNMSYMFYTCSSLTSIDLSNFNTSTVTNMAHMFSTCSNLTTLDLSSFDVSKVTNAGSMFINDGKLQSIVTPRTVGATALPLPCNYWNGAEDITEIASADASTETEKKTIKRHASHNLPQDSYTAVVEATCTEAGNKSYYTCTICGKHYDDVNGTNEITDVTVPAKGHNFLEDDWVDNGAGGHSHTCTNEGCTATETEPHTGGTATCTAKAECSVCGAEYGELAAHTLEYHGAVAATCTVQGKIEYWSCSVCEKTFKDGNGTEEVTDIATPKVAHTGGTATCTAKAKCSVCEAEYGELAAHTEVTDEAVEATCTQKGKTEGKHCSVCDTVIVAQEEIPMVAHSGGTATCTAKAKCSVCGTEYGELAAHTEVKDEAVAATCTKKGLTEGKHCSVCNTVIVAQEEIPMVAHTGGTATCTAKAKCEVCGTEYGELAAHTPAVDDNDCTTAITCTVCGYETKAAEASHVWGEYESDGASGHTHTCTNSGCTQKETAAHMGGTATCTAKAKCSVCGAEYGELAAHTEVTDEAVDATCTQKGKTEGKHCSVCNTVIVAQEEVPMVAHTGGTATCTAKAKCEVCGAEYGELAAHTEVTDEAVAATCTQKGKTEGKHCSVCNTVLVAQEEIPMVAHTGGTATCTAKAKCTVCGAEYGEFAAHTEVTDEAVEATCTQKGKTEGKHCSVCNTVLVAQEEIPMAAHTGGTATCTVKAKCEVCGTEYGELATHTEVTDEAVAATCTQKGKTEGKHCSVCDTVIVAQEEVPMVAHTGGTATCTAKAKCEVCGTEYGELAAHSLEHHDAVAATCTAQGKIEYWSCSVCEKNFKDENGTEVTELSTPMVAHTGGTATCAAKAECSVCGAEYGELAAHTEVTDEAVAATCTQKGKTEGKHCSVCNTVLVAQEEIPMVAHSYGEWIEEVPATATENGTKGHKDCTVCGKHFDNSGNEITDLVIPATGEITPPEHEKVTVTVTGGSIDGADGTTVEVDANGEVTVIAAEIENKTFKGWSADGGKTILSADMRYKFNAINDMNLIAVYENAKPVETEEPAKLSGGAIAGITISGILLLLAALYVTGLVLYKKNIIAWKICKVIYFFIK